MKNILSVLLVFLCLAATAIAQKSMTDLATAVGSAYASKTMSSLDTDKPYKGKFTVTIEDSLDDTTVVRTFKSFAAMEGWLAKREHDGMPARSTGDAKGCWKGYCIFNTQSILHNNLYLKHVSIGVSNGKAYVKSIRLLDGD